MLGRLTDADWTEHETIVVQAAVAMVDAALPDLSATGRGAVVNISSVVGGAVALDQCAWPYHVSKAGLDQLTRWLAVRCGGAGVRVNAVAPGLVDRDEGPKLTDNSVNRGIVETVVPLRRAAAFREIADVVVYLASDAASYITGQVLVVDGGSASTKCSASRCGRSGRARPRRRRPLSLRRARAAVVTGLVRAGTTAVITISALRTPSCARSRPASTGGRTRR